MSVIQLSHKDFHDNLFSPKSIASNLQGPLIGTTDSEKFLRHLSPGYEIHEDESKFELSIDAPEQRPEDTTVQIDQNGRVLHLSGRRMVAKGDKTMDACFDMKFALGRDIDTGNITANIDNGIMIITVPKSPTKNEEIVKIPITNRHVDKKLNLGDDEEEGLAAFLGLSKCADN
mmetsp:Transcript_26934/g.38644  ORF Transcript_26934/g.38644 Transcript_26934/m.38644 type:complete len:174 (+) Transcript_26934:122-643(+)|eukprot:CAMPEP_0172426320 /NCGR_PEP_ID=MMETSP1064-20121228/36843_1 /TAXON_ID=202472 /ORGANISM="Aulacoseira subarctica , Strain CCAP 1002/5" /LENGTH=173 /DNA_ID=CAMNT_0013169829 /DNA_START=8 /DNA_END=529 /DNA_ORIENTATION=+